MALTSWCAGVVEAVVVVGDEWTHVSRLEVRHIEMMPAVRRTRGAVVEGDTQG